MAKKLNRTCICCGEKYSYCNTCSEDRFKEPWHTIYHNENCKNIFMAITDYLAKEITKEQAKEILNGCDLTNKEIFSGKIPETIDEILEINKIIKIEKTEKENVIEQKIEQKVEDELVDTKIQKKAFTKK